MSEGYSKSIANAVKNALAAEELNFSFDEDNGLFRFNFTIEGPIHSLDFFIDIRDSNYIVYAVPPIVADAKNSSVMAAIAEFFCRANYELAYGNFDIDFSDGEIRYRVFVDCDGITPSKDMIKSSIVVILSIFERYAPGIAAVLFSSANPEEQINKCEAAEEE